MALVAEMPQELWNFRLSSQHFLSDCLSVPAQIWPFSYHQLISNNANRIKIRTERMILPQQDLRRHVSWCPTGLI